MVKSVSVISRISHLSFLLFFIATSHSAAVSFPVDSAECEISGSSTTETHMEKKHQDNTYLPRLTYEVPPNRFFCEVRPAPPLINDASNYYVTTLDNC